MTNDDRIELLRKRAQFHADMVVSLADEVLLIEAEKPQEREPWEVVLCRHEDQYELSLVRGQAVAVVSPEVAKYIFKTALGDGGIAVFEIRDAPS